MVLLAAGVALCLVGPGTVWASDDDDDEYEDISDQILLELEVGVTIETIEARYGVTTIDSVPELRTWKVRVAPGANVDAIVAQMEDDPEIVKAERHRRLETPEGDQRSIPDLGVAISDDEYLDQEVTTVIKSKLVQTAFRARHVKLGALDTGIAGAHPQLSETVVGPGLDFAGGNGTALPQANGIDDDLDGQIDESLHHGTFVAGLMHLVAPEGRILPVRTLVAEGQGTAIGVARGIQHAMRSGVHVINLSLGMPQDSRVLDDAIEEAIDQGVIVIASAGNTGMEGVTFPARHEEVIAVGTVDNNRVRADFSSFGAEVDLSAPGVDLWSAYGDGYASWSGSSFAAPLVAGAVALLVEKYPGLTAAEVAEALRATAQPDANGPELDGKLGAGVLDVEALLAYETTDRTSLDAAEVPGGTAFAWSPVLGATNYDLARGNLHELALFTDPGSGLPTTDLGSLVCLGNDRSEPGMPGLVDPERPKSGQAFFYVFRDDAPDAGSRSYGKNHVIRDDDLGESDDFPDGFRTVSGVDCRVNP